MPVNIVDLGNALRCSSLQSTRLAFNTGSLDAEGAKKETREELERIARDTKSLMSSVVTEIRSSYGFLLPLVRLTLASNEEFGEFNGKGERPRRAVLHCPLILAC